MKNSLFLNAENAGAYSHVFVFKDYKNSLFQNILVVENMHEYTMNMNLYIRCPKKVRWFDLW